MTDSEPGESDSQANSMEYEDEEFSYGSEAADFDFDDDAGSAGLLSDRKGGYTTLDNTTLQNRVDAAAGRIAELCCMPIGEAARLLHAFKWDTTRLQDEWFSDPDKVKERVGIRETPAPRQDDAEGQCGICFETFPATSMHAAACGHRYCKDCWTGYVHTAVESGPKCLDLRCPDPECSVLVPDAILDAVADDSHKARWRKFLLESFVEMQSGLTWCPAPDCGRAAEAMSVPVTAALDVICDCGSKYCFKCKQEAHRPVDCSTVNLWIIRDSKESENMTWILANTKNCPNCKRHIEKNQGCMHMTCSQCRHEFCWLCLGDWRKHNENTGGYYGCNMYQKARQNGELDEREMQREQAKQSLERYMHYWQRWAENDRAKAKALTHLIKFRERQQEPLSEITATPSSQLKFVEDAWKQVIDCRRILKWTYAEGYYKFTKEDGKKEDLAAEQHERFFVFNQGQAEHYLERLHHKVTSGGCAHRICSRARGVSWVHGGVPWGGVCPKPSAHKGILAGREGPPGVSHCRTQRDSRRGVGCVPGAVDRANRCHEVPLHQAGQ
ncbi:hypothetical protein ACKKBG_A21960 [Auxenochlorella protothecoides x Auxenochlorella symbiontica]